MERVVGEDGSEGNLYGEGAVGIFGSGMGRGRGRWAIRSRGEEREGERVRVLRGRGEGGRGGIAAVSAGQGRAIWGTPVNAKRGAWQLQASAIGGNARAKGQSRARSPLPLPLPQSQPQPQPAPLPQSPRSPAAAASARYPASALLKSWPPSRGKWTISLLSERLNWPCSPSTQGCHSRAPRLTDPLADGSEFPGELQLSEHGKAPFECELPGSSEVQRPQWTPVFHD